MIDRLTLKALAKQLCEEKGIKPTHAHELVAKSLGFNTYNHYLAELKQHEQGSKRRINT